MIQRSTPILALVLVVAGLVHSGCGSTCEEIRAHRRDFDLRTRATRGPDARLALPFTLMDRVLAGKLARRPPLPIALPTDKLGIPLQLSLTLDGVTTRPAEKGRLGVTLHLGLVDPGARTRILALEVDTSVAPRLAPAPGRPPELTVRLRPGELGAVRPHATPEGARELGRWLRDRLPSFARALATDEVARALADEALAFLADEVWPSAKGRLLGDAPLFDTWLTLPDLPIRELELTSTRDALVAHLTTDLPDADPLRDVPEVVHERMSLRLSGGTATGLINQAMSRGQVPARFDEHGAPKPDGPWEARVGWRGGASPLVVSLWRTTGSCRRADVAARLGLALQGDTVRVHVYEGRFVSVAGPAFAEVMGWLESVFGKAMAFTFDAAALIRFESSQDQVQLRLARIALGEDELSLDLDLGVAGR